MHRRPILALAGAAALAALLAGCTGGSTEGARPSATGSTSSPASTTSSSPAPVIKPIPATTKAAIPVGSTASPVRVRDVSNRAQAGFTSPSGHIACLFSFYKADHGASLDCEINQKSWTPPPKPRGCKDMAWAYGITLNSRASFYCGTDTIRGDHSAGTDGSVTLPYGSAMRFRNLTCTSRQTGVDCVNTTTHTGFLLSAEHYQLRNG